MARFVTGIFLAACVALAVSSDETLDELEQLLEARRNLNAFEGPQAFGNMEALDNRETRADLNAFEDPQAFDNMEAFNNMGALDNPETRGNQGEFDDLEANDDFETLENLESLHNMEARNNMDAFEDTETFDDMHAVGDLDLETSDKLEARGHEKMYDNLESLGNLGVLDKRMMQERTLHVGFEGFSGQEGSVSYKISNIKISNLKVDLNPAVQFKDRRTYLTVTLPRFTVTADWWARYKTGFISITRDGSLTATANRVTVTVAGTFSPPKVQYCRANADISVKVHGGGLVTKIILLFKKGSFVNALERKLEAAICDAITKL